jgi:hypothetical protein
LKRLILAGLAAIGIAGGAAIGGRETAPQEPIKEVHQVSVLTVDGQDYDGIVVNGKLVEGILPAAPIEQSWVNEDLAQKRVMTWCLAGLPSEEARQVARSVLTRLYGFWSNLPLWQEGCIGTYEVDDTAHIDCGIGDQAAACAM